ncbi:MAG: TIGR00153 family protein [Desulfobacterales bacterium]|nr:TIGR00153 family protein [Desulfobacterales bacterium]
MRIPFFFRFFKSPFIEIAKHAEKVKECVWTFQQAIECYVSDQCNNFEELRAKVIMLENEADELKRRIRANVAKKKIMPVPRFAVFMYIREQDKVVDALEDALNWIYCKSKPCIPKEIEKDFMLFVDTVIDPAEELISLVTEADIYFRTYSAKNKKKAKEIIKKLHQMENEADKVEDMIIQKIFTLKDDPLSLFHTLKLASIIGSVADHAENAGDMMSAMIG